MIPSMRWFGREDPVPLRPIRQIPGMERVVTALHDLPPGAARPADRLAERAEAVSAAELGWVAVQSGGDASGRVQR